MDIEKHDLHHEFPEHHQAIHELKLTGRHFARLFKSYHEIDHEIHRIETGAEVCADTYLDNLKKQRLQHKDSLLAMISARG
jgi:uncharacterized protein YdcH (DUF465 family)